MSNLNENTVKKTRTGEKSAKHIRREAQEVRAKEGSGAAKTLTTKAPIKGTVTVTTLPGSHHGWWLLRATKRIGHASVLKAQGLRDTHAFRHELKEARRYLQTALFWERNIGTIALIDKIEDALTPKVSL